VSARYRCTAHRASKRLTWLRASVSASFVLEYGVGRASWLGGVGLGRRCIVFTSARSGPGADLLDLLRRLIQRVQR
jgi:hypothetical protein